MYIYVYMYIYIYICVYVYAQIGARCRATPQADVTWGWSTSLVPPTGCNLSRSHTLALKRRALWSGSDVTLLWAVLRTLARRCFEVALAPCSKSRLRVQTHVDAITEMMELNVR